MPSIFIEGSEVLIEGAYVNFAGNETDPAIVADGAQSIRIHDSKVFGGGISLVGVSRGLVTDCEVESLGHGIAMSDTSDVTVADNLIVEPGSATDDTYDGIHMAGDSNRNHVHANSVRPSQAANATRYGINISASTCDDNVVADNMLGAAADYGTGAYNDAGTGTVTARDGNGQFTT